MKWIAPRPEGWPVHVHIKDGYVHVPVSRDALRLCKVFRETLDDDENESNAVIQVWNLESDTFCMSDTYFKRVDTVIVFLAPLLEIYARDSDDAKAFAGALLEVLALPESLMMWKVANEWNISVILDKLMSIYSTILMGPYEKMFHKFGVNMRSQRADALLRPVHVQLLRPVSTRDEYLTIHEEQEEPGDV